MPNTPGPAGYLLAWWVSLVAVGLGLTLAFPEEARWWARFAIYLVATAGISLPLAAIGVLLVHVACGRFSQQWVHVAAAGVAGFYAGVWLGPFVALMVAASTALGRLVVVPLVWARRAAHAERAPLSPEPAR